MDAVYGWVKNIVCFYILMTAVLHLLPQSSYQKYVRFFSGLLLVIMLVTPILEFIFKEGYLLEKISYNSFRQEMDTINLDVAKMEGIQKKAYLSKYEKAIEDDISAMAREKEIYVNQIDVSLNEDYTIGQIAMSVSLAEQGGIYVEKIVLSDNTKEYPDVAKLKDKLTEFYQVANDQVQIIVREG